MALVQGSLYSGFDLGLGLELGFGIRDAQEARVLGDISIGLGLGLGLGLVTLVRAPGPLHSAFSLGLGLSFIHV